MAATFAWLTVIIDGVTAAVFLRVGYVTAYRYLTITGAVLMSTVALMIGAILVDNPDLVSCSYALGWVTCFIGLGLIVRQLRR
ncbi:hypothetical protein [Rhodanobacter aciditrophus]|uniref:hypothetical protein n=1 Tax=Rhodanobacter aciditrophus TaxID=1623218 RepID=UPI003CFB97F6